jgi:predicted transcriptional regulator
VKRQASSGSGNTGIVTKLRDTVPIRAVSYIEALRLAELQAESFLKLVGVTEPPVPERVIAELPSIQVTRLSPFPTSGATTWVRGRWMVVLNGAEPVTRQRFSLAHELKHIIDHRFVSTIYSSFPLSERDAMVEQICDYFAACLLMPRPWVERYHYSGTQRVPDLARTFGVSQAAMSVRLRQNGIAIPTPRCMPLPRHWAPASLNEGSTDKVRHREPSLVP